MENTGCIICCSKNSNIYTTLSDRLKISTKNFSILQCECGFLYLNPRPSIEEMSQYYNSDKYEPHLLTSFDIRHALYKFVQTVFFRWKLYIINKYYLTGDLIDIGGGVGDFAKYMIKKGWGAILQEKYLQSHEEINRIIDVEHLYDNEHKYKYNLVTLWHSLEHIHNIDDYFRIFDRILANKGMLLIAVPNVSAPERYFYKNKWAPYDAPRHLYHFDIFSLKALCDKYKYKIIRKYSMYQDLPYNVLLSMKNHSFLEVMKAIFVSCISLITTAIFGPNRSSSILVLCKKSN